MKSLLVLFGILLIGVVAVTLPGVVQAVYSCQATSECGLSTNPYCAISSESTDQVPGQCSISCSLCGDACTDNVGCTSSLLPTSTPTPTPTSTPCTEDIDCGGPFVCDGGTCRAGNGCTGPDGTPIGHGESETYWQNSSGNPCVSETRSCYDGSLSGSYIHASCTTTSPTPAPTVTLSASPTTITTGSSSTLSWSSANATSCSATWTTSTATSGSQSVSPTSTSTYTLACSGAGGSASASATITVNAFTITLAANPSASAVFDSTDVTYTATSTPAVSGSNTLIIYRRNANGTELLLTSGSNTSTLAYTINFSDVTHTYVAKIVSNYGSGTVLATSSTITTTWASFNITSVTASPSFGNSPLNNIEITVNTSSGTSLTGTTIDYSLDCLNDGTPDATATSSSASLAFSVKCGPFDISDSGLHTVTVRATRAGLTKSLSTIVRVTHVTIEAIGGYQEGWSNDAVTPSITCAGNCGAESTFKYKTYTSEPSSCSTTYTEYGAATSVIAHSWVCGAVKNTNNDAIFSLPKEFKVDQAAPNIPVIDSPAAGDTESANFSVQISGDGDTGGAGVAACYYAVYDFGVSVTTPTLNGATRTCSTSSTAASFTVTVGPDNNCRTPGSSCVVAVYSADAAGNTPEDYRVTSFAIKYPTNLPDANFSFDKTRLMLDETVTVTGLVKDAYTDAGVGDKLVRLQYYGADGNYHDVSGTGGSGTSQSTGTAGTVTFSWGPPITFVSSISTVSFRLFAVESPSHLSSVTTNASGAETFKNLSVGPRCGIPANFRFVGNPAGSPNAIEASWDSVPGANGYKLEWCKSTVAFGDSSCGSTTTAATSYTIPNLEPNGTAYNLRLRVETEQANPTCFAPSNWSATVAASTRACQKVASSLPKDVFEQQLTNGKSCSLTLTHMGADTTDSTGTSFETLGTERDVLGNINARIVGMDDDSSSGCENNLFFKNQWTLQNNAITVKSSLLDTFLSFIFTAPGHNLSYGYTLGSDNCVFMTAARNSYLASSGTPPDPTGIESRFVSLMQPRSAGNSQTVYSSEWRFTLGECTQDSHCGTNQKCDVRAGSTTINTCVENIPPTSRIMKVEDDTPLPRGPQPPGFTPDARLADDYSAFLRADDNGETPKKWWIRVEDKDNGVDCTSSNCTCFISINDVQRGDGTRRCNGQDGWVSFTVGKDNPETPEKEADCIEEGIDKCKIKVWAEDLFGNSNSAAELEREIGRNPVSLEIQFNQDEQKYNDFVTYPNGFNLWSLGVDWTPPTAR